MFSPTTINLGTVRVKKEVQFEYTYSDEVRLIKKITKSCNCGRVEHDIKNKKIKVAYMPNPIPPQRVEFGYYETTKTITIEYNNTSNAELTQTLTFTAKVQR